MLYRSVEYLVQKLSLQSIRSHDAISQVKVFSRSLGNVFALFEELERGGIKTVTLPGWRRAVGEDMSLMPAASCAADLDPPHAVGVVFDVCQVVFVERPVERRPARTGFEFVARAEQRQPAQTARVGAFHLVVEQRAAEGRLGAVV